MIPFEFDLITAITIVLIGAILSVYVLILKKNGWIGDASNYRCPNPKCRQVFQAPVKVKDFSTGQEVGFACPECGYDLSSVNSGKDLKETPLKSEPELKIKDSIRKPIETGKSTVKRGVKEHKTPAAAHPTFKSEKNPPKQSTVQTLSQACPVENKTANQAGAKEEKSRFTCPACKKEFMTPLFVFDYAASKPKLKRLCPYCDRPIA
ncbi:MAG TPA: hypothetical protein VK536_01710 [Candidatus Limnocylindrales bacterium]|nr:hypothetical protein [Candidatus Limnocylindrales bacterium]